MKLTIYTTATSLNNCTPEQLANYRAEVNKALLAEYPTLEIEHREEANTYGSRSERIEDERVASDIQSIIEDVHATGLWA